MKESFLFEIDKDLLSQAIRLSEKRRCNLSQLIAASLELVFKAEMVKWIREVLKISGSENLFESCTEKFSAILIKEALKMSGGNRSRAARLLGLSRPTLHSKLEKLSIE